MHKKRPGFTLIELLVVISLIAVLATIGFASFQGIQGKTRDAKRKQDLKQLGVALELYYQNYGQYPDNTTGANGVCGATAPDTTLFYDPTNGVALFMANQKVPVDPSTEEKYCYISVGTTTNGQSYRLYAKLENCSDPEALSPCSTTDWNFSVASQDLTITAVPTPTPMPTATPMPTPTPLPCSDLPASSNLVSYWKLDDLSNSIAGGPNGADTGNPPPATVGPPPASKIGNAKNFDGSSSYIAIPNSANFNFAFNQDFTVSFWVKHSMQVDNRAIVEKWNGSGGFPFAFRTLQSGKVQFLRYDGSHIPNIGSTATINDGTNFHMVTGVKNGTTLTIYIDGVASIPSATDTTTGDTTNTGGLYFGSRGGVELFNGTVDEVGIWNRALTGTGAGSEIDRLYNGGAGLSCSSNLTPTPTPATLAGKVLDYPFNEGSGTSVGDFVDGNPGIWKGTLGSQWTTDRTGNPGKAGNFNGTDNFVATGSQFYNSGVFTFTAWVKGISQVDKKILSFANSNSAINPRLNIGSGLSNGSKLRVYIRNDAPGNVVLNAQSTTTVFDDFWHHIAFVDNNGTANLYIDGAPDTTGYNYTPIQPFTFNQTAFGEECASGAGCQPNGGYFTGQIDEVKIYNRALSSTEVSQLYSGQALGIQFKQPSLLDNILDHLKALFSN